MGELLNLGAQKLILGYRSCISPHKRFRCAHHAFHGTGSCSDWALGILNEGGLFHLLKYLPVRFAECRASYVLLYKNESHKSSSEGPGKNGGDRKESVKEGVACCLSAAPCW